MYGLPCSSGGKQSACNEGLVNNPPAMRETWVRRSPREGKGYPLQYSGEFHELYIVHGVAKSWTRLSNFHF